MHPSPGAQFIVALLIALAFAASAQPAAVATRSPRRSPPTKPGPPPIISPKSMKSLLESEGPSAVIAQVDKHIANNSWLAAEATKLLVTLDGPEIRDAFVRWVPQAGRFTRNVMVSSFRSASPDVVGPALDLFSRDRDVGIRRMAVGLAWELHSRHSSLPLLTSRIVELLGDSDERIATRAAYCARDAGLCPMAPPEMKDALFANLHRRYRETRVAAGLALADGYGFEVEGELAAWAQREGIFGRFRAQRIARSVRAGQ